MARLAGEREPLSPEKVYAAALDLADREGVEALTMRKLGRALGVEAMSLYNHVPDKAAVLDGIVDMVYGEVDIVDAPEGGDWRAQLALPFISLYGTLLRHPGVLAALATRPVLQSSGLHLYDLAVGVLRDAGFSPCAALHAVRGVAAYTVGSATSQAGRRPTGVSELTPSQVRAHLHELPLEGLPHYAWLLRSLDSDDCQNGEEQFRYGLRAFINGLRPDSDTPSAGH
ncbi:TetR/AcrR family transcriptional regulator C-terminal domain-containing protein [Streptomyces sp. AC563]|uniref:TetR/AcrR family transcriptional regulator C-terminal domain-containing protein n=1 Tax=Streptomyces buecherae TaxID=2763006 RepID=UPI00164D1EE0|nr:TetR/AcrR family transcriptional regulator C-terminal domain-containing protein [Streptomyces buecherae]MBC3989709.1 TetR/AcrR family transcriptional regulator C-terminal domain-containing protein [Streptomyces buecherae]